MSPKPPGVHIERDAAVLRTTFDRPGRANSLTPAIVVAAAEAIEAAHTDPGVQVIALTGAGRVFSGGMDLLSDDPGGDVASTGTLDLLNRLVLSVRQAPKPVVAVVNGPVVGVACSLVLAADLAVAKESSHFFLVFAALGLMPDGGATGLLPAAVGRARAMKMALLPDRITAREAAEWGLIASVVADERFDEESGALLDRLANGPTLAYARIKRAVNSATLAHLAVRFDSEWEGQSALFGTKDFAEGVEAVRAKRPPRFTGG